MSTQSATVLAELVIRKAPRSAKHRVGRALTNGERGEAMAALASELAAIDRELEIQHQSCEDMQRCIREMQARLGGLKRGSAVR